MGAVDWKFAQTLLVSYNPYPTVSLRPSTLVIFVSRVISVGRTGRVDRNPCYLTLNPFSTSETYWSARSESGPATTT